MHTFLAFVSVATVLGRQAFAATIGPVGNLNIVNANVAPDGFSRPAVLAGGTFPGTLITGQKGDNFKLNVVDQLTDASMFKTTSIHWHGFFQAGTNWADGPAFVNQCPIASGNSFVYDFNAVNQAGTFWYHSHLSVQYCDGLRGAFVVYDPNDPHKSLYDVDDESTVITLADWYHAKALDAIAAFPFPQPDSTLINGLGRWGAAGGTASELAVISVEANKRYRFRLVSISCDPNFIFSIDGHDMTIIEVDSVNHVPHTVDQIQIFAGQRYSFVLNANKAVDNYWIRANPNLGTRGFAGGINSAILRYVGADEVEPVTPLVTASNALLERDLAPLENPGAPGPTDINAPDSDTFKKINLAFSLTADLKLRINGAAWESPTVPVLLQILSGASTPQQLMPSGSIIALPRDTVIQLSMPAGVGGGPHPFHLHGHAFDVVRGAGQAQPNFVNPPRRDVVSIGAAGDNVTIRFVTDNPGPWFLHCHIDWHLEAGFAMVFAEDVANTASVNDPSPAWDQLCPIYDALPSSEH